MTYTTTMQMNMYMMNDMMCRMFSYANLKPKHRW